MGNLARRPDEDPVRQAIFEAGSVDLRGLPGKRRVGRPRKRWAPAVMEACLQAAGSKENLENLFRRGNDARMAWRMHLSALIH